MQHNLHFAAGLCKGIFLNPGKGLDGVFGLSLYLAEAEDGVLRFSSSEGVLFAQ